MGLCRDDAARKLMGLALQPGPLDSEYLIEGRFQGIANLLMGLDAQDTMLFQGLSGTFVYLCLSLPEARGRALLPRLW